MNIPMPMPGMFGGGGPRKPLSRIIFDKHDTSGDGKIDVGEFRALVYEFGHYLDDAELAQAIELIDTDNSGDLDYDEFKAWWGQNDRFGALSLDDEALELRRQAAEVFHKFDEGLTGQIHADDASFTAFHAELTSNGLTTLDKATLLEDLDSNGDGAIQLNEYIDYLVRKGTASVKTFIAEVATA